MAQRDESVAQYPPTDYPKIMTYEYRIFVPDEKLLSSEIECARMAIELHRYCRNLI